MKARHDLLFGSLALIISVLVAAPHIKEYKKYKKALKGDDITLCDMYLAEYPQHKPTEIIRQRKEALAYEMV